MPPCRQAAKVTCFGSPAFARAAVRRAAHAQGCIGAVYVCPSRRSWTAFWLKEHNRDPEPRHPCKECLDLRIELPTIILKRLPNLLLGLVMIYRTASGWCAGL